MDEFARSVGYRTDSPAYLEAIERAKQAGTPLDGSYLSTGATVKALASHDTAPPKAREAAFPSISSGYDKRKKEVVFTFSHHSDDVLRNHLGDCLLAFWKPTRIAKHHWTKNGDNWELRIESGTAKAGDPRIETCLHKIRTLTSNCQILEYTGEKFVAAAKEIQTPNSILHALCTPSVTFFRDQHGDICAITHEDKAVLDCEEILTTKREYEAAYAVTASRGSASLFKQQQYEIVSGSRVAGPEGLFIRQLLPTAIPSEMAQERTALVIELLLRSLDRRADSVQDYVQEEVCKIAQALDKKTLNALYRKHCSEASRLWLHRAYLRSLLQKGDYAAAYDFVTRKKAVFGDRIDDGRELIAEIHRSYPEIFSPDLTAIRSDSPEDHFLYALAQSHLRGTVPGLGPLTTELMLRSLDQRQGSIDPEVMKVMTWVASLLDRETLHGIGQSHASQASQSWLRRLDWNRSDGEASQNFSAASKKCRYYRETPSSRGLLSPEKDRGLSVDEIQEFRNLVLAAVMMDPESQAFSLACRALDIVDRNASPERSYMIFAEAIMLLAEKRDSIPFDNEQHFLIGLGEYKRLKRLAEHSADEDTDPIVMSDSESSSDH